jgi:hypothetical protein
MSRETGGAVALLPPPSQYVNPLYQFSRRHQELYKEISGLWACVAVAPDLCQRFLAYVSTDLYWVTRDSASPIAFDAIAAGLLRYRTARDAQSKSAPSTTSLDAYRAFVDATVDHAAARLSSAILLSAWDVWSPATGEPLQPWLDRRSRDIAVLHHLSGDAHQQRIRKTLRDYILDRRVPSLDSKKHTS